MPLPIPELSGRDFQRISTITRRVAGIDLQAGKEGLVMSRLMRRLVVLGAATFDEYVDYVENDRTGQEMNAMVDALTTNKTSFFREIQHFEYLRDHVVPQLRESTAPFTVWSAGCSTGQEPYSVALLFNEELAAANRRHIRILATDISKRVLVTAVKGHYEHSQLEGLPPFLMQKYFRRGEDNATLEIADTNVRNMVTFARLNLMNNWPMKGLFDLIMCRHVMIYFDQETQHNVVRRLAALLRPGGHLFIGHAETISGNVPDLAYIQPAIYVKRGRE